MLAELPVPLSKATFYRQRQDRHYELLPLKPPAEIGPVNEIIMEGVSPVKVDNVGKEAKTQQEMDTFRRALEWED